MAWIGLDLDGTLLENQPQMDPMTGEPVLNPETGEPESQRLPTDGAVELVTQLAGQGHRLTVFTAEFAPMPESEKQRLKEQIEQELVAAGFPPMEVWTGTTKPTFDVYIGDEAITYDGDWGLVNAQLQYMLEEKGLLPPQAEVVGNETVAEEGEPHQEEQPQEGASDE
jgi:hypothetical protein